jgi:hypothetical protein
MLDTLTDLSLGTVLLVTASFTPGVTQIDPWPRGFPVKDETNKKGSESAKLDREGKAGLVILKVPMLLKATSEVAAATAVSATVVNDFSISIQ